MDLYERIMELGSMGYHCSQIIMIMTLETIGEENPQLVKAMGGYFLGNLAPEEKEDAQMKPAVQELYQWFRQKTEEEFGAFYCKDITHLDWGVIMEKCPGLIADTYTKVMEILTEREVLKL